MQGFEPTVEVLGSRYSIPSGTARRLYRGEGSSMGRTLSLEGDLCEVRGAVSLP